MKIISTDKTNVIYTDGFTILDKLKPTVYSICFDKMMGYSLKERDGFNDVEPMYGNKKPKIDKIIDSFKGVDRNLGVILSGSKGMGKTLFARKLCDKLMSLGYPVVLVSEYTPNFVKFINSIEQEVVVFFDEFEKVFTNHESKYGYEFQDELLPLFDGTAIGKKLFLLTVNDTNRLSKFFLGRPGRFHYHIKFSHLSREDMKEYFMEEVKVEYRENIDSVLNLTDRINANYDSLRAIAFELNMGENIKDILDDLNIEPNFDNMSTISFVPKVYFTDGSSMLVEDEPLSAIGFSRNSSIGFHYDKYYLRVHSSSVMINPNTRNMCTWIGDITVYNDDDDERVDLSDKIERVEFIRMGMGSELIKFLG